mmetsp:Transcript_17481/g.49659  ORF Transcript_17481/g.49659 Transcript_17481/m.49659 type:complete len:148 (+) Transcript_17481:276-719(+)
MTRLSTTRLRLRTPMATRSIRMTMSTRTSRRRRCPWRRTTPTGKGPQAFCSRRRRGIEHGLGSRQLEQLIADADMDNDGGLNIDELASFVATVAAQEGGVASLVAKSAEKAGTEVAEEEDDEENFDDGDFDDAKILVVENGAHARTS